MIGTIVLLLVVWLALALLGAFLVAGFVRRGGSVAAGVVNAHAVHLRNDARQPVDRAPTCRESRQHALMQ
jgi:hypothetical protein